MQYEPVSGLLITPDACFIWFFSRSVPLEHKHFLYICFPSPWFLARVSHFSCFLFLWFALLLTFWTMSPAHFLSPTMGLSQVRALVFLCAHSWSFSSTFAVSLQVSKLLCGQGLPLSVAASHPAFSPSFFYKQGFSLDLLFRASCSFQLYSLAVCFVRRHGAAEAWSWDVSKYIKE